MTKKIVVRFQEYCIQKDSVPLGRLSGFMVGSSMVELIDEFLNEKYASDDMELLESNPRNPKRGSITSEIIDSIRNNKELFPLMSKGILISSEACRALERNRFEISFSNPKIHGILDGGHNTLAIAIYLLESVGVSDKKLRTVKRWSDLKPVWNEFSELVLSKKQSADFLIPIEIIYPKQNLVDDSEFIDSILEIAQARNNNTQLTEETKANKKGLYDILKKHIDKNLYDKIEWRTNDGGRIKVRELIALSLIPLSRTKSGQQVNPVQIYSSKSECVKIFEKIISAPGVSIPNQSDLGIEVIDNEILSALALISELPRLYDLLYEYLPEAYNKNSDGKFGRINSVSMLDDGKIAGKTKYYGKSVKYEYPDGFIMPLVYSLRELMYADKFGNMEWVVDPAIFIEKHLGDVMASYGEMVIKMANYDPQKVGKNKGSYSVACMAVRDVMTRFGISAQ